MHAGLKRIEGDFGDREKEFAVQVTFTATDATVKNDITYVEDAETKTILPEGGWTTKTVTINLRHGETITFNGIPSGVTYSVEETDTAASTDGEGTDYQVTYDDYRSGTISSTAASTTITNTSTITTEIDTGITTDNLPYIVLMGIVVLAGVAMIAKRRMAHND